MTRGANGRPIRFFAILMVGWVMVRLFSPGTASDLPPQPQAYASHAEKAINLTAVAAASRVAVKDVHPFATPLSISRKNHISLRIGSTPAPFYSRQAQATRMVIRPLPNTDTALDLMDFINVSVAFANRPYASNPDYMSGFSVAPASPPPVTTKQVSRDRWRAGAWLLWRQDGATQADAIPGGRLGGSQAGLRVDYDLMPGAKVRTAVYGRITSAVSRPSAPESAVGLSIQPSRAIPVNIAIERRIALDPAARNANAVMAVGGFGPTPIAQSIDAEGYAQTGIVGFKRKDAFIDGKFSLSKQLPSERVRIGAAISGGAQPGASRMDIGPEIQVRLPLPQGGARLSIEWRERIAGNARPGSGLAITLAADF